MKDSTVGVASEGSVQRLHARPGRAGAWALALAAAVALVGLPAIAEARDRDRGSSRQAVVDDTVISAQVQRAFEADAELGVQGLYVETYRGAVQLSGWVVTAEQKRRAVRLASQISGVRSVVDEIELRPDAGGTSARAASSAPAGHATR